MTNLITLRYFARIAELVGKREETLRLENAASGAALLEMLRARHPQLSSSARLRLAINQEHAPLSATVRPGDEVAVFEPVTGG